ncbi:MAG: DUF120 domain-containing protein [archaeon]|nr:DUF120 domain-containing protein [archaeon]
MGILKKKIDEKDWFLLFKLARLGGLKEGISYTTLEIADAIDSTQQTVSRRLNTLKNQKLVEKVPVGNLSVLKLTKKGIALLKIIHSDLDDLFIEKKSKKCYIGEVKTGMGEGGYYVNIPNYFKKFTEFLEDSPFPGTLNVILDEEFIEDYFREIENHTSRVINGFESEKRTFGDVHCYDIYICALEEPSNWVTGLILDIRRTSHKKGTVEIVAHHELRKFFNFKDGSRCKFRFM